MRTSLKDLALLLLIFLINAPQKTLSQSGCDICASTGDCSQAYLQHPGKYCGTFQQYVTTKPCCCPTNSQCQLTSTSCNCYVPSSSHSYHRGHSSDDDDDDYYFDGGAGGITLVVLIFILCCCCAGLCKSNPQSGGPRGEFVPIAVPLGNNTDSDGIPPATAPGYQASTPGFFGGSGSRGGSSGNNGGGGFAWGPALGGFILGEMLGRGEGRGNNHHRHHHRHGGGGWGGGGGGFTIPGDTGGGGGGRGGGFTIPGAS
mmetsp:Transcript_10869/g.13752  ORF Transcript_10869/g.13752 Transcript_10869/m.13752 type:complete len:258 (+) Transcript_10869:55-828(+)